MNAKHLLLATAAAFVALNFTSCKEDEFDLSFENCVVRVSPISISDGDTIRSKTIGFQGASAIIKDGLWMVRSYSLTYIGLSKDKMKLFSGKKIDLQPFVTYYIESTPYIVHDNDTVFGEKQEIKFYSIPKTELVLTADYGDGDIAANIHWKLRYYYEKEDVREWGETNHTYYDYEGTPSAVNVSLITSYDTTYNKDALDFPVDVDSCYIKQGGTRENPDYPAYIYRYWKDGKTIMYYDPVIYDFCVDVKVPVGDASTSVKDTIRSIFMDKQKFVCDIDTNIYRTSKIGNKTWTIDNYRGRLSDKRFSYDPYEPTKSVFGDNLIMYAQNGLGSNVNYMPGYHIAKSEDWEDLESHFGIVYKDDDILELRNDSIEHLFSRGDTSLQKYFSAEGAWYELLSSYGWQNDNDEFITNEQGVFNAIPAGIEYGSPFGEYKVAAFLSVDDGSVRLISGHYGGIAKSKKSQFLVRVSIRFVKD